MVESGAAARTETVDPDEIAVHVSQDLLLALPMYRLSSTQRDVFDTMLGAMGPGGYVETTQEELAVRLGTFKSHVSTAVKKLASLGLLWRVSPGLYRINPSVGFRGTVEEWNAALEEIPADVPAVAVPAYKRRPPRRSGNPRLRAV